jgi:hypothetical protein
MSRADSVSLVLLSPIHQYEADANPVHTVVVVQKALAISNIVLKIAGDPFEQGKAPFNLQSTTIGMETKIVPQHKPDPVLF